MASKAVNDTVCDYMKFACYMINAAVWTEFCELCKQTRAEDSISHGLHASVSKQRVCAGTMSKARITQHTVKGIYDIRRSFDDPLHRRNITKDTQSGVHPGKLLNLQPNTNYSSPSNNEVPTTPSSKQAISLWPVCVFPWRTSRVLLDSRISPLMYGDADYMGSLEARR